MVEHGQEAAEISRERDDDTAARIAQARAWAEREVERKRLEAREAGERLLELEAHRARELDALRAAEEELELLREEHRTAHETLQAMQRTRLWRFGTTYWRIRDALLRRKR
jgi:hypothetical protein